MKQKFSLTPRQIVPLLIGIVVVLLIISMVVSRFVPVTAENIPPASNTTFIPPQSTKVNVETKTTQAQAVNNFYIGNLITNQTGTTIISENTDYQLVYNNDTRTFFVTLLPLSTPEVRAAAENAFVEKMGISKEVACTLKAEVHDYSKSSLSQDPAISPLSFCTK